MAYSLTTFVNSPARSLFRYCQFLGNEPLPLPPPHFGDSFTIPDDWYQAALSFRVPITIAIVYAVTAKALNKYNILTGKKPWGISKTVLFRLFLVIHNVFLAVYSAWTCWGMLHALHRSIVSPSGPDGLGGLSTASVSYKCRRKKKSEERELEKRKQRLYVQRQILQEAADALTNEVLMLKHEVLRHVACGFAPIHNYISRAAVRKSKM